MKVLIVNTSVLGSSTGKIAYGFYKHLAGEGHEAVLAYGIGESVDPGDPKVVNFVPRLEPKLHFRLNLLTGYHGCFGPIAERNINRIIDEFKPDIIQLYNLHGYYLNISRLFRKIAKERIPVVYGMLDEYPYLGYCCYAYDCDGFRSGCRDCQFDFRDRYLKSLFFNRAKQTYDLKRRDYDSLERIVFTGPEWVVKRASGSGLLKGRDVRIVDEYIDNTETFVIRDTKKLRKELGISADKIVILDVAPSADRRKGVGFFVKAAERICGLDERYVFINVGYSGRMEALPENFIGIGYVADQKKLSEYYSLADLFVCTSIADTMPNSCLDALSCGTPVLGFDITGIPYVAEEPLGTFIDPENVDQMVEHILKTGKKSNKIKESCREYAVNRYSLDTYYKKQMEIYRELL